MVIDDRTAMKRNKLISKRFSKQGRFAIVIIMVLNLYAISCLCTSSTPKTNNDDSVEAEPSSTFTETEQNIESPTTTPTKLQQPTATITATIEPVIDVFGILGKPVNEVENIVGQTILITLNDDADDDLAGGEYRDYVIGDYDCFVVYDKYGIARVFQVLDGLVDENYSLSKWGVILPQFGVYISSSPDRTAPLAIYWDNYNGYFIGVIGDPVWTVQIAEAEYAP